MDSSMDNLDAIRSAAAHLAAAKEENAVAERRVRLANKEQYEASLAFNESMKNVSAKRKTLTKLENERHALLRLEEVSGN